MTTVTIEEIQLVNIISLSQIKLKSNFQAIIKRLNAYDDRMNSQQTRQQQLQLHFTTTLSQSQQKQQQITQHISKQLEDITQILHQIQSHQNSHQKKINQLQNSILKNKEQSIVLIQQLEQTVGSMKQEQRQNIDGWEEQRDRIYEQISRKENKSDVQAIDKKLQELKMFSSHVNNDLRSTGNKIQKIQIMAEKQQRNQIKKDSELIKEIDEKIKKQLKEISRNITNTTNKQNIINNISHISQFHPNTHTHAQNDQNRHKISIITKDQGRYNQPTQNATSTFIPRSSVVFKMEGPQQDLKDIVKTQIELNNHKIYQKIKKIQTQHKNLEEILKNQKQIKKQIPQQNIKQRFNQLIPQVTKISCKLESLEHKILYNQRKMEEKDKKMTQISNQLKQNSTFKLQERLKAFQGDVYSNIKDIKTKLDLKLNSSDHELFVKQNQERLLQINQMINIKSDKMQVKKALIFLQAKIKQIILVISEQEENEKDALLTKKQIKCISCDKQIDKLSGIVTLQKQNWDSFPWKEHSPEILGKFGMTNFGSLSKKIKKLQNGDLPILKKKKNNINQSNINP